MWVHWGMRKQALLFWWEGTRTETCVCCTVVIFIQKLKMHTFYPTMSGLGIFMNLCMDLFFISYIRVPTMYHVFF